MGFLFEVTPFLGNQQIADLGVDGEVGVLGGCPTYVSLQVPTSEAAVSPSPGFPEEIF